MVRCYTHLQRTVADVTSLGQSFMEQFLDSDWLGIEDIARLTYYLTLSV
ncbi:hypothetical protein LINGRAHAP2_LOCUS4938 [Linum grandiflorum]